MKNKFEIKILFSKIKGLIKLFRKVFEIKPYENNKEIFYDYKAEKLQLNSYEKCKIETYKEKLKNKLLF